MKPIRGFDVEAILCHPLFQFLDPILQVPILLFQSLNVTPRSGTTSNSIGGPALCVILEAGRATARQSIAPDLTDLQMKISASFHVLSYLVPSYPPTSCPPVEDLWRETFFVLKGTREGERNTNLAAITGLAGPRGRQQLPLHSIGELLRMLGLGLLCGSTIRFVGRGAFRRHTGRHEERRGRRKPWPWQMPGETPGR